MDYHSVLINQSQVLLSFFSITVGAQTILILAGSFLLIISFFVSGSEVAFFSLSNKDLNVLKTHKQPSFRRIVNLMEQPRTLLASMRIAGSFVNMGIILIASLLMDAWLEGSALAFGWIFLIKVLVIGIFLILFAEVLPKVWASYHGIWFASMASLVIEVLNSLFIRLSKRTLRFNDRIEKSLQGGQDQSGKDQIDYDIDLLSDQEATSDEKRILKGIRKFGDTNVKQIMRTRMDVNGIDSGCDFAELLRKVEELHYSRLPVYDKNLDNIKGILHTKDLLPYVKESAIFDWKFLIRKPFFVHEQKLIDDLLQDFRNKRMHFSVVVDEFGGTSGIVTLEDIMEEIIGEIKDEFDDEESGNRKIDDNNYIFEGRTMIYDACKAMGLPPDTFEAVRGDSDSMAGLLLEIAGEFPQVNARLTCGDFTFVPLEINRNRIDKIKVIIQPSRMES